MRGEFENIWNDAFEGASITPSDGVWNGIAARMDSSGRQRNWVTILLIAATVTVAFAFPLTVGNSEYEFKPMKTEVASREASEGTTKTSAGQSQEQLLVAATDEKVKASHRPQESSQIPDAASSLKAIDEKALFVAVREEPLTSVNSLGMQTLQPLSEEPGSLLDQYYILPAIRLTDNEFDKSLLAFGNINMGSQSASNGFNDLNLQASADFENSPDLSNRANENRSENGGTALFVGAGMEIPLARRLNLTAGVGYQNQRLNGSSNTIYEENGQQFPLGIYDPVTPGTIYLSENYNYISSNHFISIPVGAKFTLVDKHVKFRVGLGVSPDFMLSHKVSATEYGTNRTAISETAYNAVQFTGLLNLDVLIPMSANYGLAIESGMRQGLVPYVNKGSQYTTTFNFGVILFYQLRN